jgi:hypothetical protein
MILRARSFFADLIDRLCVAIVDRAERTALRHFERALTIDASLPSAGAQFNNIVTFAPKRPPSKAEADSSTGELG